MVLEKVNHVYRICYRFLDKVTHSVDSGNCIDVIFLDFAKAFDKVPHKRLILKLESHGISRKVLQWVSE